MYGESERLAAILLVVVHKLSAIEKKLLPAPPYHEDDTTFLLRKALQREVGLGPSFDKIIKDLPGVAEAYYDVTT